MARPAAIRTARPTTEEAMSARQRPVTTADGAIGSDRNRSVMPRAVSVTTAVIVASTPKTMARASIPGTRKSL
jgi:hypothetical protein